MELNLENVIELFGLFCSLLFSFYVILVKTKERQGNLYIGLFFLFISFGYIDEFITYSGFYSKNPNLWMLLSPTAFLFYPAMFFYLRSVAFKSYKLKKVDAFHLLPYVAINILSIVVYHSKPVEVKMHILETGQSLNEWYLPFLYVLLRIMAFVYMILSVRVVYKFRRIVLESYSNMEKRNYRWILQLTFVFVYFIVAAFFDNIIRFFIDEALSKKLVYVMNPINILFLLWVIYKAMSQPYLFNGVDTNEKLLKDLLEDSVIRKRKEKESHLSEETSEENNLLKAKLDNYMQDTEVFLNPSLTIFDLAKPLEISVRDLSSFINNELDKHFFDFVNEYRIEKAKRILSDSEKKDFTILEILYEVGFNSKSSFNTAFKKHTGTTPTEYRKKHLISAA